jgi:bifunctional DNA-binding transcriptional regulator/antitoxin component of YhaV-PrlF toxin-antitoxin module
MRDVILYASLELRMAAIGRVQSRGQVTLPRSIREATGITPGAELVFLPLGPGRFEVRLAPARRTVRELLAAFATDAPPPTPEAIAAAVEDGMTQDATARQQRGEAADA